MWILKKAGALFLPFLVYWGIYYAVLCGFTVLQSSAALLETALDHPLWIMAVSACIAIPVLRRIFHKEWMKRTYIVKIEAHRAEKYLYTAMISGGFTVAANLFLNGLHIFDEASGYGRTAAELFSESIWIQIFTIGILMPIVEELIFRGIVLENFRQITSETISIFLTSLMFAIYHGNVIQGIYAFVFSILMIYVYKKTGSLTSAIAFHIVSNLSGIGLEQLGGLPEPCYWIGMAVFACLGLAGVLLLKRGCYYQMIPIEQWSDTVQCIK